MEEVCQLNQHHLPPQPLSVCVCVWPLNKYLFTRTDALRHCPFTVEEEKQTTHRPITTTHCREHFPARFEQTHTHIGSDKPRTNCLRYIYVRFRSNDSRSNAPRNRIIRVWFGLLCWSIGLASRPLGINPDTMDCLPHSRPSTPVSLT